MLEILVYVLAAIVIWPLWLVIHEMSHIAAARMVGPLKSWAIKPYPNKADDGHWRFASAKWTWEEEPTPTQRGLVSLAPRVPNLAAIMLILATFFLTGIAKVLLLIFCAAGVIGLVVGSIGSTKNSDLQKGAEKLEINPWAIRVVGLVISLAGAVAVLFSLFS
jgi:hypothetical protein